MSEFEIGDIVWLKPGVIYWLDGDRHRSPDSHTKVQVKGRCGSSGLYVTALGTSCTLEVFTSYLTKIDPDSVEEEETISFKVSELPVIVPISTGTSEMSKARAEDDLRRAKVCLGRYLAYKRLAEETPESRAAGKVREMLPLVSEDQAQAVVSAVIETLK